MRAAGGPSTHSKGAGHRVFGVLTPGQGVVDGRIQE